MQDINFRDQHHLSLYKNLWHADHIILGKRLGFDHEINGDNLTMVVDLRTCSRKALMEFLKASFHDVVHSNTYSVYRKELYRALKERYDAIRSTFYNECITRNPYHAKLRPYQVDDLCAMAYKRYNLLSWSMGLGKTLGSVSLSRALNIRRTIIVCPASVKWSIFRDLTENWGYNPMYFTVLDAQKRSCLTAFQERFVIVNYDVIGKYMDYLCGSEAGHIILDECHKVKEVSTTRFKMVEKLIRAHNGVRVTMMSGTPIRNRPNDLFALLRLAEHPLGENHAAFLREFTRSKSNNGRVTVTGGKNLDRLFSSLSNFLIRRTKEECLKDLPDKVIQKYIIKSDEYLEEYNKIIEEMMQVDNTGPTLNGSIHSLNRLVSMAKLNASPGIINLIDSITEGGQKVVVFSFYKSVIEKLQEHYKGQCAVIHGGVNVSKRDEAITRFKNDESCMVFIGQTDAAGEGIDLTVSSQAIFCDIPFTSTQLDQALSRVHRSRQKSCVNVYYCMAEDSIDDMLFELVAGKAKDISEAIDRDKPTLDYDNIGQQLFNKLISNYKRTHA